LNCIRPYHRTGKRHKIALNSGKTGYSEIYFIGTGLVETIELIQTF